MGSRTRERKIALLKKYGNQCYICGRKMKEWSWPEDPEVATIEHVVRKADGGTAAMSNLRCVIWWR